MFLFTVILTIILCNTLSDCLKEKPGKMNFEKENKVLVKSVIKIWFLHVVVAFFFTDVHMPLSEYHQRHQSLALLQFRYEVR